MPTQLKPGRVYSWEEVGEVFAWNPNLFGRAGGMISRPEQNAVLLLTSSSDGRTFDYGDEWKDGDLIYAGQGLTGNQQLSGVNRFTAENSRDLFLFEYAGPRRLLFYGQVTCADHWESTDFDKNGESRRVYRFRLRLLNGKGKKEPKRRPPSQRQRRERDASSFKTRPFDPNRKSAERRRRSAPKDPERQLVLAEQADSLHQKTLTDFGLWLKARGWEELDEMEGAIDLLAVRRVRGQRRRVLFEIKGLTPTTERTRVRSGLAQLLEYRLFLGEQQDGLCLVTSRPILDRRLWLLDSLGIAHAYVEDGKVTVSGSKASRTLFGR
ncbi:MAG TPA: hypothetical protein VFJ65_05715 [Solirubrobacterales bacterium]|nr:hypothetical protein [Solirubrobacterales bacterium]